MPPAAVRSRGVGWFVLAALVLTSLVLGMASTYWLLPLLARLWR